MRIPFWKMHGAGNDFILVDDRAEQFPSLSSVWVQHLCARRTGIGAEGVILIQPSKKADFRVRFFNPDGTEVDMCGNGARCVARLVYDLNAAQQQMAIETHAGIMRAEIISNNVRLWMTPPSDWRMNQSLELHGRILNYHFVNTGVPHVVIEVEDLDHVDILRLGAGIRYHEAFSPRGTNVNFMSVSDMESVRVRTYERGVEAETMSCGTGVIACALIAGRLEKVTPPVYVTCASNNKLEVNYRLTDKSAENVSLLGPACYVFEGTVDYEGKFQ